MNILTRISVLLVPVLFGGCAVYESQPVHGSTVVGYSYDSAPYRTYRPYTPPAVYAAPAPVYVVPAPIYGGSTPVYVAPPLYGSQIYGAPVYSAPRYAVPRPSFGFNIHSHSLRGDRHRHRYVAPPHNRLPKQHAPAGNAANSRLGGAGGPPRVWNPGQK